MIFDLLSAYVVCYEIIQPSKHLLTLKAGRQAMVVNS